MEFTTHFGLHTDTSPIADKYREGFKHKVSVDGDAYIVAHYLFRFTRGLVRVDGDVYIVPHYFYRFTRGFVRVC